MDDIVYRGLRYGMKILGTQSAGVRLGFDTGFDSGSTLDYVYRNQPQGSSALGRLIDKNYLNSVGWKGIRQRKIHLQTLIQQAVVTLAEQGKTVRVVDVAAGHGRYVLDALEGETVVNEILLRDYSELNVSKGQEMIASRGMAGRARFEQGDAFNREELAALEPRPTLGIVSGLYELFPENTLVCNSLAGLAEAIEPGGILIYTGQPWHPQLKTIAWSLTSHKDGKAWVMRVRTQGKWMLWCGRLVSINAPSSLTSGGFSRCLWRYVAHHDHSALRLLAGNGLADSACPVFLFNLRAS